MQKIKDYFNTANTRKMLHHITILSKTSHPFEFKCITLAKHTSGLILFKSVSKRNYLQKKLLNNSTLILQFASGIKTKAIKNNYDSFQFNF